MNDSAYLQIDRQASSRFNSTAKRLDNETGLYYYGARYYNPLIGRFITPDTVVQNPYDTQSLNRYTYCRNNPVNLVDPSGHFFGFIFAAIKAIASAVVAAAKAYATYAAAHPIIAGAVTGGILGGANAAINGTNIGQGIGLGILGGAIGGGVGMGVGNFLEKGMGSFWAGMAGAGVGGAAAGASTSAILGGDAGMAALAGMAGAVIAFGGSRAWLLGADAVAGGVSSVIQGGDFGEGAAGGAMNNAMATMLELALPMETLGNQDFQEGDLAYFKADSPIGLLISFFDGGAFSHVGLKYDSENMVSATFQRVPGGNRNGVGSWKVEDYSGRGARVVRGFRGNQAVIKAASSMAVSKLPITYGFLPNQKVCSTTCGNVISSATGIGWTGIGPNSQYQIFKGYGE